MKAHVNIHDHLFSGSISERIPTLDKVCLLLPHLKHYGDLVWHTLTLYERVIQTSGLSGNW